MYPEYFPDLSTAARFRVVTYSDSPDTHVRLTVSGELDAATAGDLHTAVAAVLRHGTSDVVDMDLAGVSFADSAGVRCLVTCQADAERAGRRLRLIEPCPAVQRVLEITGVMSLFEVSGPTSPTPGVVPRRRRWSARPTSDANATVVDARATRQAAQQARERAQNMRREDEARRARIRAARGG